MIGHKHLIECHCVLPLYKNVKPVVYHKFSVYSKIQSNKIIPKYVNCNNCGITHYVYEICKSDIKVGKEDIRSSRTIEDVKFSMPDKIVNILEEYNRNIDDYELIEDILEEKLFPYDIVINREIIDEEHHIKILSILSEKKFKIKSETISTIIKEYK